MNIDTSNGRIIGVHINVNQAMQYVALKEPIPMPSKEQKVLCIDTVGWRAGDQENKKCFMDIKIGTYTKSTEQFEKEGAGLFKRLFKKIEHNLKDLNRDSREYGFDIDAGNQAAFNGLCQNPSLEAAVRQVMPRLESIRQRMNDSKSPVTFIGSSLFIVFNLTTPENSEVKLIDPDHPILLTEQSDLAVPGQIISAHKGSGLDDYRKKWRGSFTTGMNNIVLLFNSWLAMKKKGELNPQKLMPQAAPPSRPLGYRW